MGATVPAMQRPHRAGHHGPCTQCGAPDEPGAHVCGYCRSQRVAHAAPVLLEVTTMEDAEPRYIPAMRDVSFRH
ncbi:MAG TPA: hypothetical protein VNM48_17355 [Chloroflexota bacterium]|nr:hypothetical protein [Chloroflexota bacterium]